MSSPVLIAKDLTQLVGRRVKLPPRKNFIVYGPEKKTGEGVLYRILIYRAARTMRWRKGHACPDGFFDFIYPRQFRTIGAVLHYREGWVCVWPRLVGHVDRLLNAELLELYRSVDCAGDTLEELKTKLHLMMPEHKWSLKLLNERSVKIAEGLLT